MSRVEALAYRLEATKGTSMRIGIGSICVTHDWDERRQTIETRDCGNGHTLPAFSYVDCRQCRACDKHERLGYDGWSSVLS